MKKFCKLISIVLLVSIFGFVSLPVPLRADDFSLVINGDNVTTGEIAGTPFINSDNRVMVPLRLVNTYLDMSTNWSTDGTVHIKGTNLDITLKQGDIHYTQNGKTKTFLSAPTLLKDRLYLPLRDMAAFYGDIAWNNDSRTVTVWPQKMNGLHYRLNNTGTLVRTENGQDTTLAYPDAQKNTDFGYVFPVKIIDGKRYVRLLYGHNHANKAALFLEDGQALTYLGDVNGSSSFTVQGNLLYHTDGLSQGPWSTSIRPQILYRTNIKTGVVEEARVNADVNTAVLIMHDGHLCAVSPDFTVTSDLEKAAFAPAGK